MMNRRMTNLIIAISFVITFVSVMIKMYLLAGCVFIFGSLFMVFYKGGDK